VTFFNNSIVRAAAEIVLTLGINLTNVDRIAIGLGTKDNVTIPGSSCKMFFDDIGQYQQKTAMEYVL